RAERETDAMQADRIALTQLRQHVQIVAAGAEVVFRMRFEPVGAASAREPVGVVRGAKADSHAQGRDMPFRLPRTCAYKIHRLYPLRPRSSQPKPALRQPHTGSSPGARTVAHHHEPGGTMQFPGLPSWDAFGHDSLQAPRA